MDFKNPVNRKQSHIIPPIPTTSVELEEEINEDDEEGSATSFINKDHAKCSCNPRTWCNWINWHEVKHQWLRCVNIGVLVCTWLACVVILIMFENHVEAKGQLLSIASNTAKIFYVSEKLNQSEIIGKITGPFLRKYAETSAATPMMTITMDLVLIKKESVERVRGRSPVAAEDIDSETNDVAQEWQLAMVDVADVDYEANVEFHQRLNVESDAFSTVSANTVVRFRFVHTLPAVLAVLYVLITLATLTSSRTVSANTVVRFRFVHTLPAVLAVLYVLITLATLTSSRTLSANTVVRFRFVHTLPAVLVFLYVLITLATLTSSRTVSANTVVRFRFVHTLPAVLVFLYVLITLATLTSSRTVSANTVVRFRFVHTLPAVLVFLYVLITFATLTSSRTVSANTVVRFRFVHTLPAEIAVLFSVDLVAIDSHTGVYWAAAVLVFLYVLIIFDVIHRTLAAMIASTMALAVLAIFHHKPGMKETMNWIDSRTLLLLFSMMLLVQIISKTGIFDYMAVMCYRVTRGKIWPLIMTLCLLTGLSTAVMDNVTTVLLTTPVTIKLCEMLKLDPVPVLMAIIMFCNIFGAWTPIGDPPNLIISGDSEVKEAGVNFGNFSLHMGVGVWLAAITVFLLMRYVIYRDPQSLRFSDPLEVEELRHELAVWQRTVSSMSTYTTDETALRKVLTQQAARKRRQMQQRDSMMSSVNVQPSVQTLNRVSKEQYHAMLKELTEKYPIRNYPLLYKSMLALGFAVIFFFLHSVPGNHLGLEWVALLAAILLLVLADNEDLEGSMARVEWATLMFFAALFVLMEALTELGLVDWIGQRTQDLILRVDKKNQLTVAIMLVLWVSAIASSCIDNIPLTQMMIKIVTGMAKNPQLALPLQPLVWALAFGGCFGGNGTLIGSSANVVCTGVAAQHGYKISFMQFFKIGFPLMLTTIVVASIYLLFAHVLLTWH